MATNVTKTFLPPREEVDKYLDQIWDNGQLTNQGPLLRQFEMEVEDHLGVEKLHFVANGTLALQLALRALNQPSGEVITTPFSYVATSSAILWEHYKPVFVDIEQDSLCLDPQKLEAAITEETRAILPVHVFGNPCDVEAIDSIAKDYGLPVIYDASHAFGVEYQDKSLFSYGDISTCSFHATKIFHTIEGGGVFTDVPEYSDRIELMKRFGHNGDDHRMLGINAKASEFQAAFGLVNLIHIAEIIAKRKAISEHYDRELPGEVNKLSYREGTTRNYAYYPIVLKDEETLLALMDRLKSIDVFPRRYFYPALNTLPYIEQRQDCPIAEDIARRIICLPLYDDLDKEVVSRICEVIKNG